MAVGEKEEDTDEKDGRTAEEVVVVATEVAEEGQPSENKCKRNNKLLEKEERRPEYIGQTMM